jgi:hypothetical protein
VQRGKGALQTQCGLDFPVLKKILAKKLGKNSLVSGEYFV